MKMNYVTCEKGKSQYGDERIKKPVEARYIHAKDPDNAGNPLIEALPLPRLGDETINAYTNVISAYDPNKAADLDRLDAVMQIKKLRKVRAPLPFHQMLEEEFYSALVESYSQRDLIPTDEDQTCIVEDEEVPCGNVLTGDPGDPTYGYFNMTGYGGTGKSSAIKILKSRYPKAIRHNDGEGGYFTQIVYIVVTCKPNHNLDYLLDDIGNAVDKALLNTKHTYRDKVASQRNLGKKTEAVKDLIAMFSIGAIILDEVQVLDDTGTYKGASLSYLLDIMNDTKVAMIPVGTQDAKENLFSELHTARRVGVTIDTCGYCDDKEGMFTTLVKMLLMYQWCEPDKRIAYPKEGVQLSKEETEAWKDIVDTLYDLTKGIVDNLVTLYSRAWLDYLDKSKDRKPKINGDYFRMIAYKYYPGIQDILKQMDLEGLFDLNKKVKDDMKEYFNDTSQKAQAELITSVGDKLFDERMMHDRVIANFEGMDGFNKEDVEKAYQEVIKSKEAEGQDEMRLTIMVTQQLQKKPVKRSKRSKMPKKDLQNLDSSLQAAVADIGGGM